MSEILSSLITPEVKAAFTVILIIIVILYLMSIVWVVRDSYLRGASPVVWGIIAIVPFIGCMIYAMLRPPLYASDQEEQNIGLLLQQRELMAYGECPQCGYPTERDYVICPNCHMHLKNTCAACGRTLEPEWTVCPYCGTQVGHTANRPVRNVARGHANKAIEARQSSDDVPMRSAARSSQPALDAVESAHAIPAAAHGAPAAAAASHRSAASVSSGHAAAASQIPSASPSARSVPTQSARTARAAAPQSHMTAAAPRSATSSQAHPTTARARSSSARSTAERASSSHATGTRTSSTGRSAGTPRPGQEGLS